MLESLIDSSSATTISPSFSSVHESIVLSDDEMSSSIDAKQSGTAASFEEKSPRSDAASLSDDTDPSVSSDHDDDDDSDDEDDGFEPDHSGPTPEDEAKTRGRVDRAVGTARDIADRGRVNHAMVAAGNIPHIPFMNPAPPGTPPPPPAPEIL